MSWTAPRTWVAGETVTAAIMNTHVRDNLLAIAPPPMFFGWQNTGQNLTTSVTTAVALDSEVQDSDGGHDTVTNNSRYTAPKTGWYHCSGSVSFPINGTGRRIVVFRVNGVSGSAGPQAELPPSASTVTTVTQETEVFLNAGDYVELYALQTSGGTLTLLGGASTGSFMLVRWDRDN